MVIFTLRVRENKPRINVKLICYYNRNTVKTREKEKQMKSVSTTTVNAAARLKK